MTELYRFQNALEETDQWVRDRVEYRKDPAVITVGQKLVKFGDQWSSSEVILNRGYGDCEDFAIVATERLVDIHKIEKDQLIFILANTKGLPGYNHAFMACKTDDVQGMMTCADAYDHHVSKVTEKYWDPFGGSVFCRKWASVVRPEDWFIWSQPDGNVD